MLSPFTRAAITATLVSIEQAGHREGWDCPPVLFALFDHPAAGEPLLQVDDTLAEPGLWTVPDPARPGQNLPTAVVLHRFAADLCAGAAQHWLRQWLRRDGRTCVGVGLLFEAWAGLVDAGYHHGDLATSSTRREVRVVAAVDAGGGLHRVIRGRGAQRPAVAVWPEPPAWAGTRRIITGLRRLVQVTTSH
ncbi:hypothetical protein [Phytohabitans kaempferiae]|uniref:Uncharacterized protein n=1 Tax=Phytohabitans kaempferiae TaxID=1620943 RepID=A0ABV6M9E2_9ACTN